MDSDSLRIDCAKATGVSVHVGDSPHGESDRTIKRTEEDLPIWYVAGSVLIGLVAYAGSWIYCVITYGFLIGVSLGWFPSMIVGFLVGALWPLLAIGLWVLYNIGA